MASSLSNVVRRAVCNRTALGRQCRGMKTGQPRGTAMAAPAANIEFDFSGSDTPQRSRPLYLDFQATTPTDPRVLDAMMPFMIQQFGNPHSRTHAYGWEAEAAVEDARAQIADLIGADAREIIFTSGATESNNLAIKGVGHFYKAKKNHIITLQTEHKCVLDSCRMLQQEGFEITYLPVQRSTGLVDVDELRAAIRPETSLVSIMTVNNEIGVTQPVAEIGALCRENKVFFHTDAAQAVGKIPINVNDMQIDLLSISGHKIYGPKGVGALYVRRRPRVRLEAIINGGGQERGMRSGTLPTPLAVGLGKACAVAKEDMDCDTAHINMLSKRLVNGIVVQVESSVDPKLVIGCSYPNLTKLVELEQKLSDVVFNGDPVLGYPGCINLSFAFVEGESLLMALKDVALSSGSACTSASLEPSYVLRAIGAEEDLAHSSIRFGMGRFTTTRDIDHTVERIVTQVTRLREMSPLWEMHQEGIDISKIEWAQH